MAGPLRGGSRLRLSRPRSDSVAPYRSLSPVWLKNEVEDDGDAFLMQRRHRLAQLLRRRRGTRRRIECHEGNGIVAPAVDVRPSGGRWRSSIQAMMGISSTASTPMRFRVRDDGRMSQSGDSAALGPPARPDEGW